MDDDLAPARGIMKAIGIATFIWAILVSAGLFFFKLNDADEAAVTAQIESNAAEEKAFVHACIAQYGVAERWASERPLRCSPPAIDSRHLLSTPVPSPHALDPK